MLSASRDRLSSRGSVNKSRGPMEFIEGRMARLFTAALVVQGKTEEGRGVSRVRYSSRVKGAELLTIGERASKGNPQCPKWALIV
jgi:hypothetical protein